MRNLAINELYNRLKYQKETGTTLTFFFSEAIHCSKKRIRKRIWPIKPIASQTCSVVSVKKLMAR